MKKSYSIYFADREFVAEIVESMSAFMKEVGMPLEDAEAWDALAAKVRSGEASPPFPPERLHDFSAWTVKTVKE